MFLSPVLTVHADDLEDSLNGSNTNIALTAGGAGVAVGYNLKAVNNDGLNGCNVGIAGDSKTVTFTVSTPNGVVASPNSLTFDSCTNSPVVTVTYTAAIGASGGSVTWSKSSSTGTVIGSFDTSLAGASVAVSAPAPTNTGPRVTVTDVIDGASYEIGSVPTAGCNVDDAEDTGESASPAITGSLNHGLGQQTVTCSYTDNGGLTGSASATYWIVDTGDPSISFVGTDPAANDRGWITSVPVTLTWDCADTGSGVQHSTVTQETSEQGSQSIAGTCTDWAGNEASDSQTIKVDSVAPLLSNMPDDLTVEATSADGAVADWEGPTATDNVDNSPTIDCNYQSGHTFPLGTTTVSCKARDDAGNESTTQKFTVTVGDTTAPTVDVPEDITTEAVGPEGAIVTYNNATAHDIVDGDLSATCSPASGATFPLGTTVVECTATDSADNVGSARFSITVADTTAPVLSLPVEVVAEATGPDGASVEFTVSANDLVDGNVGVACDAEPGDMFELGMTTVECSATDSRGNSASGSFMVTVADTTAPDLTVPSDQTVEATGSDGATVTFTASAFDIVDGEVTATCVPASGSTFTLGNTTVTCSATDAAGNIATATFGVKVQDTTPPTVTVPAAITVEATGATGAVATFETTASDIVDGTLTPECDYASGGTFPLGMTTVTCSAEDAAGNEAEESFSVTVVDTTPPTLSLPEDFSVEATGPNGAAVNFTAKAIDIVDGSVAVSCEPASGSILPLGDTTVECSATDESDNTANGSFTITVTDTTPPVVTVPDDIVAEATGPDGASVNFTATAADIVDGTIAVTCSPAAGSTFALGTTAVNCSATDAHGNTGSAGFTVTVRDTTPPAIVVPAGITAEATGPSGAAATYAVSASDLVDGTVMASCSPASGSTFALGATTVNCSATDAAGNSGSASFTVTVQDTTAPALNLPATMIVDPTSAAGAAVTYAASANDLVDGTVAVTCAPPSGSTFPANQTTQVNCSATDAHGNKATGSFQVTVRALMRKGFYQPVDMNGTINTVKAGSTVPLKFEVFAGTTELTDISVVKEIKVAKVNMSTTALTDEIETTATGGTGLRYDSTGGQFIYNWSTKGLASSQCYQLTLTLQDGSTIIANFKMK
jgi:hypothetical protein